ncbi:MAG: SDR family oxidoreductase [Geodermatophilaceae bacterium]
MPVVLVTGISRRVGIAWTIAERLRSEGWTVVGTGWPTHDGEQPWGADENEPNLVGVRWVAADLADPDVPGRLVDDAVVEHGSLDALVCVHARSSMQDLTTVTAAELDTSFAVNTRSTVLLTQAAACVGVRRIVLFTTGVHQGPMPTEIPYVVSKAALQGVTATLAAALAPGGATVNCINPGPNDTGYATEQDTTTVRTRMPLAPRWGQPSDTAALVSWLVSDEAGWITGQTIDSDGGWGIRAGVPPRQDGSPR